MQETPFAGPEPHARQGPKTFASARDTSEVTRSDERSPEALVAGALRDLQGLATSYLELARAKTAHELSDVARTLSRLLTGLSLLLVSLPFLVWSGGVGIARALDTSQWIGTLLAGLAPLLVSLLLLVPRSSGDDGPP